MHMGDMADMINDDFEDWPTMPNVKRAVTCRDCKKRGLHWEKDGRKWRLHDAKGPHQCKIPCPEGTWFT